jgi:hypothetical protein
MSTAIAQPIPIPLHTEQQLDFEPTESTLSSVSAPSSCPQLVVSRFSSWSSDSDSTLDSDYDADDDGEDEDGIVLEEEEEQQRGRSHVTTEALFKLELGPAGYVDPAHTPRVASKLFFHRRRDGTAATTTTKRRQGILSLPRVKLTAEIATQHPLLDRPSPALELSLQHEQVRFERALSFAGVQRSPDVQGGWQGATESLRRLLEIVDDPSAALTTASSAVIDD